MHYLGRSQRGLYHGEVSCDRAPAIGVPLRNADGRAVGEVLDRAPDGPGRWLVQAVLRHEAANAPLYLEPEISFMTTRSNRDG
jgi:hypothetical protein